MSSNQSIKQNQPKVKPIELVKIIRRFQDPHLPTKFEEMDLLTLPKVQKKYQRVICPYFSGSVKHEINEIFYPDIKMLLDNRAGVSDRKDMLQKEREKYKLTTER